MVLSALTQQQQEQRGIRCNCCCQCEEEGEVQQQPDSIFRRYDDNDSHIVWVDACNICCPHTRPATTAVATASISSSSYSVDIRFMSLPDIVSVLRPFDEKSIIAVRKINRLMVLVSPSSSSSSTHAHEILLRYFNGLVVNHGGRVLAIYFLPYYNRATTTTTLATRPSSMAFMRFDSPESVEAILRIGSVHHIVANASMLLLQPTPPIHVRRYSHKQQQQQ